MGRARACRSAEGSKSRSRVAVRAVGSRVGREAMAGRKGVAVGLRVEVDAGLVSVVVEGGWGWGWLSGWVDDDDDVVAVVVGASAGGLLVVVIVREDWLGRVVLGRVGSSSKKARKRTAKRVWRDEVKLELGYQVVLSLESAWGCGVCLQAPPGMQSDVMSTPEPEPEQGRHEVRVTQAWTTQDMTWIAR